MFKDIKKSAASEAKKWGHNIVDVNHLFSACLKLKPDGNELLKEGITDEDLFGDHEDEYESTELIFSERVATLLSESLEAEAPWEHLINSLNKYFSDIPSNADVQANHPVPVEDASIKQEKQQESKIQTPNRPSSKKNRSGFARIESNCEIIGRDPITDNLINLLGKKEPSNPCLVGPKGIGKESICQALATKLLSDEYDGPLAGHSVFAIDTNSIIGTDRGMAVRRVLKSIPGKSIIVIKDLEVLFLLGGNSFDIDSIAVVRSTFSNPELRVILSIDSKYISKLEMSDMDFFNQLSIIKVPPLTAEDMTEAAKIISKNLSSFHDIIIPDELQEMAFSLEDSQGNVAQPGLGHDAIDSACTLAKMNSCSTLVMGDFDIKAISVTDKKSINPAQLIKGLKWKVKGQDEVVDKLCSRLSLTRSDMDLTPERPDAVFLLVGPTGVGKTSLARAVSFELFGNENKSLIRLDMSEYAQEWALSRLIGPQPGYVGYTEPEGWLTTKIIDNPNCVLILDEIEKAHPTVWNTFLQVFDAGILTDSRGKTASFSDSMIFMTSNLGARSFSEDNAPMGFENDLASGEDAAENVLRAVKDAMPPELINRFDDILMFYPLSIEHILEIADMEVNSLHAKLTPKGFNVEFCNGVTEYLAKIDYNASYGARHLKRNIEKLLLQPLSTLKRGSYLIEVNSDGLAFTPK